VFKFSVESLREPGLASKFYNAWMPVKDKMRRIIRENTPKALRGPCSFIYKAWNTLTYLVKPFLGASLLYFDILKDFVFFRFIFFAVQDLTGGDFSAREYNFEFILLTLLVAAFLTNAVVWIVISHVYSREVFEMCRHNFSERKMGLMRLLAVIGAPLMPAFLLANYVYYLQKGYTLTRELQTCEKGGSRKQRERLFMAIERTRYRAKLHRRIYSYFRVTTAIVQSFNTMVVILVIVVVSGRPDRRIQLLDYVTERIAHFFGLRHENGESASFLRSLVVTRDTTILFSVVYSLAMIISALVRYVFQCKDQNLSVKGKVFLSVYFGAHVVSKLTSHVALLSTAEKVSYMLVQRPILICQTMANFHSVLLLRPR